MAAASEHIEQQRDGVSQRGTAVIAATAPKITRYDPGMLPAMEEGPTIHLGAGDDQIDIALHQRPFPTADEPWDRDAIDATVRVRAGTFQGTLATTIWSHELRALGQVLRHLYAQVGTATHADFDMRDGALQLTFDLSEIGHLQVHVEAYEVASHARLSFVMAADQTYLPLLHHAITEALDHFPPQM